MSDKERLMKAHSAAQAAFHAMVVENVQADWEHPLTKTYLAAERVVDDIMIDLRWERTNADLDAALGDHHIYPAGVGR